MTGPFDAGARMAPAPQNLLSEPASSAPRTGNPAAEAPREACGRRWQEIGTMFMCRCYRPRRAPHVCECVCRAVRP